MNIDDGEAEAKLELDPISLRVDLNHHSLRAKIVNFVHNLSLY